MEKQVPLEKQVPMEKPALPEKQISAKKRRKSRWTEENILLAFDKFIRENGRLPTNTEVINNPDLPKHSTIKNRFGIEKSDFYRTYYPQYVSLCPSRYYHYNTIKYWTDDFKAQYIKLNFPTMEVYDRMRNKHTPCSRHLVKILNLNNWNELLSFCGFEIIGQNINSTIKPSKHNANVLCQIKHTTSDDKYYDKYAMYYDRYDRLIEILSE